MRECRLRNNASLLLALATAAAVLGFSFAHAAEPAQKTVRLGFVHPQSPSTTGRGLPRFWDRLAELGWVRGRNLVVEEQWAEGNIERLPTLMADLVGRKVDVIVTYSTPAAAAAKSATSTIPIVVASMGDPVGTGVAASLAHPGGNLTGLSLQMTEGIPGKWLELLQETVPRLHTVAVIGNPDTPLFGLVRRPLEAAALARNLKLRFMDMRASEAIEPVFGQARRAAQAALVIPDPLTFYYQRQVAAQAAKDHLPVIYGLPEYADAGGLMAYGPNQAVLFRRAAEYVDKILRGANPADLPIEQATQYVLIVNLRTAHALGLTMPTSILQRADEVIR
jgi:putative ABC transport system substrate-binding protein